LEIATVSAHCRRTDLVGGSEWRCAIQVLTFPDARSHPQDFRGSRGRAGNVIRATPLGTILQTLPSNQGERDIAALPDGGYCVLEKKPGGQWRIARAKGEYWRYVNYASDTRPDGTSGRVLYLADLFPPAVIDD
jgi:hypothetical protein